MTSSRLNAVCALISITGSLVCLAVGSAPTAFIWLVASLVWLVMAVYKRKNQIKIDSPGRLIGRRISRLLLFS